MSFEKKTKIIFIYLLVSTVWRKQVEPVNRYPFDKMNGGDTSLEIQRMLKA